MLLLPVTRSRREAVPSAGFSSLTTKRTRAFPSAGSGAGRASGSSRSRASPRFGRPCASQTVDAALADHFLADGDGLEVLATLKAQDASLPVVLLTGHGTIDLAVKAIKEGAEQFFTKPVELPALLVVIERALENRRMRQVSLAGKTSQVRQAVDPFFGESAVMRRLAAEAAKVAASSHTRAHPGRDGQRQGGPGPVAPPGEPPRRRALRGPELRWALSRELLETELFGHEKGAFTGAVAAKPGLLEVAHRGTLFLDEIGDVDLQVQAKLLKVVEELRFRRLAHVRDRQVDVRLLAATHRDLAQLVRKSRNSAKTSSTASAPSPSWCLLCASGGTTWCCWPGASWSASAAEMGRPGVRLSAGGGSGPLRAPPGRATSAQLRNVLERAVLLSDESVLEAGDLGASAVGSDRDEPDLGSEPPPEPGRRRARGTSRRCCAT